jgi:signal transduction histidine kinase/CheY-like chemotaxis protein
MSAWFRFVDWPLRAKIVALLVAASLVPLGIATWISLGNARADRLDNTEKLLRARAEMLVRRIDAQNNGYTRIANLLALSAPEAIVQASGTTEAALGIRARVQSQLQLWTRIDPSVWGVSLLDSSGRTVVSSGTALPDGALSRFSFVRSALEGTTVVSDIFLIQDAETQAPTIAYLSPVRSADGAIIGVAAVWVNATHLGEMLRELDDEAGPGSFAILVDSLGIRIGHLNEEALYRPVQPLATEAVEQLVAEQRFGPRTREYTVAMPGVYWDPPVDFRNLPDVGMYRVRLPDGTWGRAVGHRCNTVGWMVYHMFPEQVLLDELAALVRSKLTFAALIMVIALAVGLLFASAILRPLRRLALAARDIGAGDLDVRVGVDRQDELGELGNTFNSMATRIQEQAAALRRESEDQYRKLFQAMTESFCAIELIFNDEGDAVDFIYLEANREFELRTGMSDLAGKRMSDVVPDLDARWLRMYARVAQTGVPVDFEDEDPENKLIYQVRAYRVGGAGSRRVAVLFQDITQQKLTQKHQQSQLESLNLLHQITRAIGERQDLPSIFQVVLRAIEEQLPVDFGCIFLYEPGATHLDVERIGERSLALAHQMGLQDHGQVDIDPNGLSRCVRGQLVYEPDVREVAFPFPQRLAAGGLCSMVAAPLQVESLVFGVLVAARRTSGFSSPECEFLRQLSEHVALAAHHAQLYTALQKAYQDLRETQLSALQRERLRALGQMASGIAHDINNAISPVVLYTESLLAREGGISEPGRSQLQTIQRAIEDVAATVARMREFYRDRESLLTPEGIQLNELVPQVIELTRPRWMTMPQQRGTTIELRTEFAPDLPLLLGAGNEIREALTNLVFNAVDAMPEGGTLTLRTACHNGKVQVEVHDTGIGMDEDSRRRCLEPFFTTKGERGTGLGLAMVYGMAQRHGAGIEIESMPGKGTCVRLSFQAADAITPPERSRPATIPGRLRILLIDDDPVLLRSMREILELEGQEVEVAGGGQEGVDLARKAVLEDRPFSVAFTDLGMPHMDGRQVAIALKAIAPRMPVVMLTGWGERLVSKGDVPQDVDLVLSKPPKVSALRSALAQLCGAREDHPAGTGL